MINNSMRIGGLASGMDIDSLVNDLMKAERIPLNKMQQDQTWMTWKRDAYREMNSKLSEFENLFLDMKLSNAYKSKSVSSSQPNAVTASATSSSNEGSYSISVSQLASKAVNVSQEGISSDGNGIDPTKAMNTQNFKNPIETGTLEFSTFDKDGVETVHSIQVNDTDSLNDVFQKISDNSGGAVRGFYDTNSDKVFLERTESGNFNTDDTKYLGSEIGFNGQTSSSFFTNTLQIKNGTFNDTTGEWERNEAGGTNANFTYNGIQMESFTNEYTLDSVTFEFNNTTNGDANITVRNDTQATFDKIVEFVGKYNEIVESISDKTSEKRYRDYPPLTDQQREGMSEREIELWEEKAKSGLLSRDNILQSGLSNMRQAWYSEVTNTNSNYDLLADIGITTSPNYRDNGKLVIDEVKLKEALQNDPDSVQKLFSNSAEDNSKGLINRVEDALESTMDRISEKAGREFSTLQQYSMGRELDSMDNRISDFERRLQQVETRYWNQFTEMEKAISRMNQQSSYLMQQFGGGA